MIYPNVSMTLPKALLSRFANVGVLVETGSYDGRTIQMALDNEYKEVYSVEVHPAYQKICAERFANCPNVHLYGGDSLDMLPHMLYNLRQPAVFWLDAHYQEGAHGRVAVPLLQELDLIAAHPIKTHIIMIDDRRLMGMSGVWQGVLEDAVRAKISAINPTYIITLEDSLAAKSDILVAIPT